MEMQQLARWQVTNLELSKELRKLGEKQESLFYWVNIELKKNGAIDLEINDGYIQKDYEEYYSAPTVAELGEGLPSIIGKDNINYSLCCYKGWFINKWYVAYKSIDDTDDFPLIEIDNDILVNAMAEMKIYLIRNKLI
jgi:hypothetical protein